MHNQSTFLKYQHIVLIAYFLYKGEHSMNMTIIGAVVKNTAYKYEEIILKLNRLKRCNAKPLWLCVSVHSMKVNRVRKKQHSTPLTFIV